MIKFLKFNNSENLWNFEKSSNTLNVQVIKKNNKKNKFVKKIESFAILIFVILKFRNIDRSTFRRSKFWSPPNSTIWKIDTSQLEKLLNILGV